MIKAAIRASAFVIMFVVTQVASESRLDEWSAFWASGFFSWPGWAFVQALGGLGTVGALVVVIMQFRLSREQTKSERAARREDYERSRTPDVSIEIIGVNAIQPIPVVNCQINADGRVVAYNVIVNVRIVGVGPPPVGEAHVAARYLRAPGSTTYRLEWPHGWGQERPVWIEIPYRSVFGRQYRVVHTGTIGGPEGIRITDEPTIERANERGEWVRWGLPD